MDHGWDGFYTSQKRLQRFPVMVETGYDTTVRFTGTPPQQLRFKLEGDDSQSGIKVKIPYPVAGTYSVRANGVKHAPMAFDDVLGHPLQLNKVECGENRFQNLANWLEFYITPGCQIDIKPLDAIVGAVRMQWTLEEFWAAENDPNAPGFADRLASILGIHPSRVVMVQVYEGSAVVRYVITEDDQDQDLEEGEEPVVVEFDKELVSQQVITAA
jgi:hypothetical protein